MSGWTRSTRIEIAIPPKIQRPALRERNGNVSLAKNEAMIPHSMHRMGI